MSSFFDKEPFILSTVALAPALKALKSDLSLAIGEKPGFDRSETTKAYSEILRILEHAKKNNIFAGIHNGTTEYATKMIEKGFNFVTIASDLRALSAGAKATVDKMKGSLSKKDDNATY